MRRKAVDDVPAVRAWRMKRDWCAACGRTFNEYHAATAHHILGGRAGRSDEPCNLLALCWSPCHQLAEQENIRVSDVGYGPPGATYLPKITLAVALSLKLRSDPDEFDLDRIQELHGRPIEPEPIPEFFVSLWKLNRPEFR